MIRIIDDCIANQFKQSDYIMELFKIVDFILNNPNSWSKMFEAQDENDEIEEDSVIYCSQIELVKFIHIL